MMSGDQLFGVLLVGSLNEAKTLPGRRHPRWRWAASRRHRCLPVRNMRFAADTQEDERKRSP
jgi:hypothetical protein